MATFEELSAKIEKLEVKLDLLIEMLTNQRLEREHSAESSDSSASSRQIQIEITKIRGFYDVSGDTKSLKNLLKEFGARWNPSMKSWTVSEDAGNRFLDKIKKDHKYINVISH